MSFFLKLRPESTAAATEVVEGKERWALREPWRFIDLGAVGIGNRSVISGEEGVGNARVSALCDGKLDKTVGEWIDKYAL